MLLNHDAVLKECGGFGKFQFKILLFIILPIIYQSANSVTYIFTSRSSNYRCLVNECEKYEGAKYDQEWLNYTLPGTVSKGKFVPESCYKYNFVQNDSTSDVIVNNTCTSDFFGREKQKCNEWVFDQHEITMVNTWPEELACKENQWKLALLGTFNYFGVMIGSVVFGLLSDLYGRRKVFIISIIFMSLSGIGQAFSISYPMLLVFTWFNAAGAVGVYFSAFVLVIESIDKNKREISSVFLDYCFSLGQVMAGLIAYNVRYWRYFTLWIAVPPLLFIIGIWLIPESMCWLISKELYSSAYELAKQVAKDNKKQLSSNLVAQFEGSALTTKKVSTINIQEEDNEPIKSIQPTYWTLLRSKIMLIRILAICCMWGTNALVFFGLSLNSVNLSGNVYYNFIFGSLAEIPGYTISWICMNKIGRRMPIAIAFLISGVTSVVGAFAGKDDYWLQICTFVISKMAISTTFCISTVYTAEMMPTNLRSGSVGIFSTIGRLTTLFAPFIPLLANFYRYLPLVVFGSVAIVAGFMVLLLPETIGQKLPETLEEAEDIGKRKDES